VGGRQTLDAAEQGSLMEAARQAEESFETVQLTPNDLAVILYISGTTGWSKGGHADP